MWFYLLAIAVALLCYKIHRKHRYWAERGVKQDGMLQIYREFSDLFLQRVTIVEFMQRFYDKFPETPVYGTYSFGFPTIIAKDPDVIRQMTIKDFSHFMDHGNFFAGDFEPLWARNLISLKATSVVLKVPTPAAVWSPNLNADHSHWAFRFGDQTAAGVGTFKTTDVAVTRRQDFFCTAGDRWRYMRATLSPSFTSIKMKAMFNLMADCAKQFADYFDAKNEDLVVEEMKDIYTRYSNDVIANCAFGIEVDSLKNRDNQFYKMGKTITDLNGVRQMFKNLMLQHMPKFSMSLGITFLDKTASAFFTQIVEETIKLREEKGIVRPDMIHLLMEARKGTLKYEESHQGTKDAGFATAEESELGKSGEVDKEITMVDMTANALIFFFAGFETSSTLMAFMSHELAINTDIQKRLLDEVDRTREVCGEKLGYDDLSKMKYLDMVISETLRKWAPAIGLDRVCTKDYKVETPKGPIEIPKGSMLIIPTLALHNDARYYPDPQRFDPERFNDQNRSAIDPRTYLPFGSGPRSCIGSRFALLETKVLFYYLLSKFELVVVEKTQVPLKVSKTSFAMQSERGVWLGLKRRSA